MLYQLDMGSHSILPLMDIPGVGDTAFPSIHRLDAHRFLLANYTSPLEDPSITWLDGQLGETLIYLMEVSFVALP